MSKKWLVAVAAGALSVGIVACGGSDSGSDASGLSGTIRIDGSSTVAPLTEAVAEEFQANNPDVKVTVGTSGTGGGFEKFCAGETDINDASRAIEPEEVELCKKGGIEYGELQVANDALTVVVNPNNPVKCMTVDQLKQVWEPDSKVTNWSQIDGLQPAFDSEAAPYGPGSDSGTFDFFTEAVNGEEGAIRKDYNDVGEDDNATVTGVSGAEGGIGYFGYSFYVENEGTVKALEIDGGSGCVAPSVETAQDGSYAPLSRPLYIYPSAESLKDETTKAFLEFYVDNVNDVAEQVGFVPLTSDQQSKASDDLTSLEG